MRADRPRFIWSDTTGAARSRGSWRAGKATLADAGVPAAAAEYVSVLGEPAALEAALAWYRAAGSLATMEIGPIAAPTLYVWGDRDSSVGRSAAEWTAEYVTAPYRFEPLAGVGHFVTDEVPEVATRHLLAHLRAVS